MNTHAHTHMRNAARQGAVLMGTLALAAGGLFLAAPSAFAQTANVSIVDGNYSPKTLTVAPGTTVTWTNNGTMEHTVTADNNSFDSGYLPVGSTYSATFTQAGSYPYYCIPHGGPGGVGMSGMIVVDASLATSTATTTALAATTAATTTTATSTATTTAPVISAITATPTTTGASIRWMTTIGASSQVAYGTTTSYGASSTLDSNPVTNHMVTLSGLSPSTLYHFMITSRNASGTAATSSDMTFTTLTTATSTATSTTSTSTTVLPSDIQHLQNQINQINQQITAIKTQMQSLANNPGGTMTVDNTFMIDHLQIIMVLLDGKLDTLHEMMDNEMHGMHDGSSGMWNYDNPTMPPLDNGYWSSAFEGDDDSNPVVTANAYTVQRSGSVTFTGSGFDPNEEVTITAGSTTVDTVQADSSGNFTATVDGPSDTGETTYEFTGSDSGESDVVVMTVNS